MPVGYQASAQRNSSPVSAVSPTEVMGLAHESTEANTNHFICTLQVRYVGDRLLQHERLIVYAWLSARIGMVTLEVASEDPSMWQRPSKMPPGSITRHGE